MPYLFEHEKLFLCMVAFVIVCLLYLRVRVARRVHSSSPVVRESAGSDRDAV